MMMMMMTTMMMTNTLTVERHRNSSSTTNYTIHLPRFAPETAMGLRKKIPPWQCPKIYQGYL